MSNSVDLRFDVASAVSLGRREVQEDALICDFPIGADLGFAVLADGMGGHAAGDIASKIVVTEVFAELKLQSGDPGGMEDTMAEILRDAAMSANNCIGAHAESQPGTEGMGATLVAPVLIRDRLYWVSVGDSPLFLFRDGELRQLNQDHSMAPQIDFLARTGMMEPETAINHPDRQCLTSVLAGRAIAHIDCPQTPVTLQAGDVVIAASDGLQFLDDAEISRLLDQHATRTSAELSAGLLRGLKELDDPDQDNVSFCVIRVLEDVQTAKVAQFPPPDQTDPQVSETAPEQACNGKVTILAATSDTGLSLMYRASSERSA